MIRPASFGFDPETAESNEFQRDAGEDACLLQERAESEFDGSAGILREKGVNVFVVEDTLYPRKPDAIFPNNWVSFHEDGTVFLYPMLAKSRRAERRLEIIEGLRSTFEVDDLVDLSHRENEGQFLEGTGSMVLDRANRIAYASMSPRTDEYLFREVCERVGYQPVAFRSHGRSGREIYHTNVMLCIARGFAVVCLDSISDLDSQKAVAASVRDTGHELIDITFEQMADFAANMLALRPNEDGEIVALSRRAHDALSGRQRNIIERHGELVPLEIPTIEAAGGGSVRCMIAEIFLKRKDQGAGFVPCETFVQKGSRTYAVEKSSPSLKSRLIMVAGSKNHRPSGSLR